MDEARIELNGMHLRNRLKLLEDEYDVENCLRLYESAVKNLWRVHDEILRVSLFRAVDEDIEIKEL